LKRWMLPALILLLAPAIACAADSYQIPNGGTVTIDEHGECREVTNNIADGLATFVATKTANEWSVGAGAFLNALPTGVTAAACSPGVGTLYCAGSNVGDGTTNTYNVPTKATLPSGVTALGNPSVGSYVACAVATAGTNTGKLYCWGLNGSGAVGDGSTTNRTVPTAATMPAGVSAFSTVSSGYTHTCAIASAGSNTGKIYCWGDNTSGQLGDNTTTQRNVPTLITMPSGVTAFSQVSASDNLTCALASAGTNAGRVYCWGVNVYGGLGDNTKTTRKVPTLTTLPSGVSAFGSVASSGGGSGFGFSHSCAIASAGANAGKVYCWGVNAYAGIGDNTTTDRKVPTLATMPSGVTAFSQVSVSDVHSCALASAGANAGRVYCWGRNQPGAGVGGNIGDNTATDRKVPTLVTMPSGVTAFTSVSAGGYFIFIGESMWEGNLGFTCAIGNNNRAYCWGTNSGQYGDGTTTSSKIPVPVNLPAGTTAHVSISAGGIQTMCMITNP
jgi:alpha-tubulin suppressor-like RCC1 family protein